MVVGGPCPKKRLTSVECAPPPPKQLPDINEGHDTVDLAATLPNPITNAMEASMKKLREEQGNALDDDALARLLPIDAAKRDK